MEGFGIARRTYSGGFALRSRSLLELMAYDEADLTSKLEQYHKRRPDRIFDPKNNRRILAKPLPMVDSNGHLSPLTNGQEADLLAPFAPAAAVKADGSQIYVELSFAIVRGSDGEVIGAMAQARDITERFQRDRDMRRRLRELEHAPITPSVS